MDCMYDFRPEVPFFWQMVTKIDASASVATAIGKYDVVFESCRIGSFTVLY